MVRRQCLCLSSRKLGDGKEKLSLENRYYLEQF
jgi:hypothetical protein